ncbi:MAG: hypothetical protein JNM17_31290 [Archangium sp.]|nr:hypothetical protein [Archangium sp.]
MNLRNTVSPRSSLRTAVITAAMTLLAACQQPATGPKYEGEPLFTVKGEMALTNGSGAPSGPIRLAVGWYPHDGATSAPRAMVTQEVQYQGTFPLSYTFSFFGVPPASALTDYTTNGVTTRASFGVLLAYEDLNGNGQLDTIPSGGSGVDRVLGTSLGDRFNGRDTPQQIYVAYVDGTPPAEWTGYSAGYQLWQDGSIVAANTPVNIPLDQTNELNYFVCEEFISSSSYGYDLPCNIAPTGGVRVIGNVYRTNGVGGVSLKITDGTASIPGLSVELNGVAVPYHANEEIYGAYGTVPVNAPGRNVLRVNVPGQQARVFEMDAPADFALTAPLEGKRLEVGSTLDVAWTRAAGANFYQTGAYRVTPPNETTSIELVYDQGQLNLGAQLTGFTADDYYQLEAVAFAPNYLARGLGGSMVNVSTQRSTYIDVIPANAGLRLEGTVTHITYGGQTYGSAWMSAFDGITELTNADVQINGDALVFEPTWNMFGIDSAQLTPGSAAAVSITGNNKPTVSAAVVLPGDFTVDPVPATQSSGTALTVSWTASAGATSTRVWVSDMQGQTLFYENVLGTSVTIPALGVTGDVNLSVGAVIENPAERHLLGSVQKTFALTLTP